MSTISVVKKDGYIAIAADSMAKWGAEKNTAKYVVNHNKIIQIGENYIAITGPASGHHALTHYFSKIKNEIKLRTVDEIYARWKHLHQALKDEYHLDVKDDSDTSFESSTMDILIANPYGIFAVGSHRDIQEFSRFYAYGSGNEYALGAMYISFEEKHHSAKTIAELGVEAATEFDDATGMPLISYVCQVIKSN